MRGSGDPHDSRPGGRRYPLRLGSEPVSRSVSGFRPRFMAGVGFESGAKMRSPLSDRAQVFHSRFDTIHLRTFLAGFRIH
jgi:hypothetical protein